MAKDKSVFTCSSCGAKHPKWSGQCASCKEWNTLVEEKPVKTSPGGRSTGNVIDFSVPTSTTERQRISTGFDEGDRVLGGGFYPDSLTLLVGNPGIGKSTFALQAACNIAKANPEQTVLVISGEESAFQVTSRAERLGGKTTNLKIASAFRIEDILSTAEQLRPALVVVDSVQTFTSGDIPNAPGSLPQIRAVTENLMHLSKSRGIPVLLIGQVNKGGEMAGPQLLAHLVDAVLQFEGDDQHELRILRGLKNRFGSTSEVGVFEMTETGLSQVKNPSSAFLEGRLAGAIGSTIFPTIEGQRPFLIEIQALTVATPFGLPKRSASGISVQRLALLLAVLEKHSGVKLSAYDVFANVVGGLRVEETAADLAIASAVASSRAKKPIPEKTLVIGEVGLSGEVRGVSKLEKRLKEGEKLGFDSAIVPAVQKIPKTSLSILPVRTVSDAIGRLL